MTSDARSAATPRDPELAGLSRDEAARRRSTPRVRRLAAEHGVALAEVAGSGFGGRVRPDDLLTFLQQATPRSAPPRLANLLLPLTAARQEAATRAAESWRQVPASTLVFEIDVTGLVRQRLAWQEEFRRRGGAELSTLAMILQVAAATLAAVPGINASLAGDDLVLHRTVAIGVLVSVEEAGQPGSSALVAPVLRAADRLSLAGVASALDDLLRRAQRGELRPDEEHGATLTVDNRGAAGSFLSAPILPLPQATMLTLGEIQRQWVVRTDEAGNDRLVVRAMLDTALTYDSRVIDATTAARFMRAFQAALERLDDRYPAE